MHCPRQWLPRRHCSFLLNDEELATIWHLPTTAVTAAGVEPAAFVELEPPAELDASGKGVGDSGASIGRVVFRERRDLVRLGRGDRLRHMLVIGKTGMGKSTLLKNMIQADMTAGHGLCLIDPHGDLADSLLPLVPRHRTNDVVVFDVGDREFPVTFNPLVARTDYERPLVADGIVSSINKVFDLDQAPRLAHILRNTLLALLESPNSSLVSLHRMLSDGSFRKRIASRLTDIVVRDFWLREFAGWTPRYRDEAVPAVQNKIGPFLSNPIVRNIVGQVGRSLELRRVMDEGKILIVNLSKGRIGEGVSSLLGSFLVTSLQLAAMSRADAPESERRDFYLYIDEFQNFSTESFATILSEARKYGLGMTLAHQYLGQVDETTMQAVFGNIGTYLAFQVGPEDAEVVASQLSNAHVPVEPQHVMCLPQYTAYARLLHDGLPSRPFSLQTLKPQPARSRVRSDRVRRSSRRQYAQPVNIVESEVKQTLLR